MKNIVVITWLLCTSCTLFSQNGSFRERIANRSSQAGETPLAPDYAELHSWASHPLKHDFGDSIPAPLQKSYSYDSTIDVFFIHPTTYLRKENDQMNGDVDNETLNKRTDNRTILNQASVFNEYRLYAPRYRQANYSAYLSFNAGYQKVFDTAYEDVKNAFQYYLDHWNNGHPFFIASHSQGSQHAVRLIRDLIEGTTLEKKLIAAYIIGIPPVKNPNLKMAPCTDPMQTGCYIAWNTFTEEFRNQFNFLGRTDLKTVNPLTWTNSEAIAKSSLHKGAIVNEFNSVKPHALSAQIKDGKLVISSESIYLPDRMENLHVIDINLFYVDIRENLRTRVSTYKKKN
jgi:hypothetical protein